MVTTEFTFTLELFVGMLLGNLPRVPQWLLGSGRGEWFIKTVLFSSSLRSSLLTELGMAAPC